MYRKLADQITLDFTVHLPTTGAVSDADALPTVEIWEDDTDTTLAGGTVTKRVGKTGNYRVAVAATAANGFEVGKSYNVVVTVIAGTITAKAVVGSFFIDGKRHSDLNDLGGTAQSGDAYIQIGVAGAGLTALGDTRLAELGATNIPADVDTLLSRIASALTITSGKVDVNDKAGFSISGTTQTLDALATLIRGADSDTLKTLSDQIDLVALGVNSGLSYRGTVTAVPGVNQFTIPTLAGVGTGAFVDTASPYKAFVFRDAGGLGVAPQGETQDITAYDSATGVFTTNPFTAPGVGAGDDVIILKLAIPVVIWFPLL